MSRIENMPGRKASRASVPVEVAIALSRAAHDHLHSRGIDCPHDIGLALADALAPFWVERQSTP